MKITGAQLLIKLLKEEGVDTLFGYPGGYAINIFDELYNESNINVILPRHEQALIHAADGYARVTGKPGVCLVTSGPGATNTITGLATAYYDSVPLICITGQVPTTMIGTDAFQEADIFNMTRSVSKHNYYVKERKDLGRIIKEAFYVAQSGRPGPVVIDLPADIQKELGESEYIEDIKIDNYCAQPIMNEDEIAQAIKLINESEKPLFLVGGGLQNKESTEALYALVEKTKIPVVNTLMGLGVYPEKEELNLGMVGMHGCYSGNQGISNCDLLIAIGTRFNDRVTLKISEFAKRGKIIHIDIDASELNKRILADVTMNCDGKEFIKKLLEKEYDIHHKEWLETIKGYKTKDKILKKISESYKPKNIIKKLSDTFTNDIVTTDVGQQQMWTAQNYAFNKPKSFLTSGGMGTMGFGLPSALGAAIGKEGERVISISGDGGFQMNMQELATIAQLELPIIIIVFNNAYLGMVRQWQQLLYDKKYSSTCLKRRKSCPPSCNQPTKDCPEYLPNFLTIADAYHIENYKVTNMEELNSTLNNVKNINSKPVFIEIIIEQEDNVLPMVPSGSTLTEMILDE
ncbi:acetolactate synthase large subunit [Natranaerovirga hydrolytica]|uniref:Acetolactate synthase n=1 Tax=Natranaerovirga hydrolytica TaxID=680378 RepID=A0A4R1MJR1_9FIRM|nr:biosynthetic-type acetolactate synthase large subunit [Natranaerovirga hydrolytica]TCK92747.1 acetolactate synthase large subunit [Natranaerovirga hydrolytica]